MVRLRLRETSFVDVREFDLATFSLLDQLANFRLNSPALLLIAVFNYSVFTSRSDLLVGVPRSGQ